MNNHSVEQFKYGLVDSLGAKKIPDGSASKSLNFITRGDKIELRKGFKIYGTEQTTGRNRGTHTAYKADGTEVLFTKRGRKLLYYDEVSKDFIEVGTDLFPAAAVNDDLSMANYNTLAGAQAFVSSPNGGLWKIMVANPGNAIDQYNSAKNYKGRIRIKQNRMMLFGRNEDKTARYDSYIDKMVFTTVSAEVLGTGNGTNKVFSGTLAQRTGKRTVFGIKVTGSTEIFTDDYNGNLISNLGGTGTINYATGAIAVTFNTAPLNAASVTVDYQYEDSTNNGICDFTYTAPNRTAGQGNVFRQDDGGGAFQNLGSYNSIEYCFHEKKTWAVSVGADDTTATNLIYRDKVGISSWKGIVETGSGIFYADDTDKVNMKFRLLTLDGRTVQVIPVPISNNINLDNYAFDQACGFEFGDYVLFSCREQTSSVNNKTFAYHKVWKSWDLLDYGINNFTTYKGKLIGSDAMTDNVLELLSGWFDGDQAIVAYWEGSYMVLGYKGLKKAKRMVFEGEINPEQAYDVYADFDFSGYTKIGSISGKGTYIDRKVAVRSVLGADTIGEFTIGGESAGQSVYHYQSEFKLKLDKFQYIKLKIVPTGGGYMSVEMFMFEDIRRKGMKQPKKYRTTN